MSLVFTAIAPHGFPLIPDLSDDAGGHGAPSQFLQRRTRCQRPTGVGAEIRDQREAVRRYGGEDKWHGRELHRLNDPSTVSYAYSAVIALL